MKTSLRALLCAAAVTTALLSAACGEEEAPVEKLDAAAVSGSAVDNLRAIGTGAAESTDFVFDSGLLGYSREVADSGCAPGELDCVAEEPIDGSGLAQLVQDSADFLEENVLIEANLESSSASSVTYRLRPESLCDQAGSQTDPAPAGGGDVAPDAEGDDCARILTDVPVRLVVSSPAEGDVDVELLVGDARANPVDFRLHRDELGLTVDLAGVKAAVLELAAAMGEEVPQLPEVVAGVVDLSLRRDGPQDYTVAFSVLSAVEIAGSDPEYSIGIAVADPAFQLRLDGASRTATVDFDVAAVDVVAPLDALWVRGEELCEPAEPGAEPMPCGDPLPALLGTLAVHLGGASGELVYDGSSDRVTMTDLGLGDTTTTATLDGRPLLALDLNANAGRRLDLTAEKVADGVAATFTASLDLALAIDGATLADQLDVPAWAMDEELRVTFDGAEAPRLVLLDAMGDDTLPAPGTEQLRSVARVEAGRLTLSSSSLAAPIVVETDACLNHTESAPVDGGLETEEPHPFSSASGGVCQ